MSRPFYWRRALRGPNGEMPYALNAKLDSIIRTRPNEALVGYPVLAGTQILFRELTEPVRALDFVNAYGLPFGERAQSSSVHRIIRLSETLRDVVIAA